MEKYKLVFIGTIGEGKTTAICHLFNLISNFPVSKKIHGKTRSITEVQELLATGSGRTTICEVIIEAAPKTYIEIEPYSIEQMENMIIEFCESLADLENMQGEAKVMISKEIETAIRNVIDLNKVYKTITEGGKKKTDIIDKAKKILEEEGLEKLKKLALSNANLESINQTRIEFEDQDNEHRWLKETFASINSTKLKKFAITQKIRIFVSDKDLQEYIEKQDAICLFATNFKDAPETNIRELMKYYLSSKSRDFHRRFVTLVITHKGEPENPHFSQIDLRN